jgi:predicted dehydrogenase
MLEAGKHVACEKPLAGTLADARAMRDAAQARRSSAKTFVWYNYRRCPAVALAHQLVQRGRIGRVYHVRATYLQSWGGPETPLLWRFDKSAAGSGAHGDLNAHIVDMCRFVTGEELTEIHGAVRAHVRRGAPGPGHQEEGQEHGGRRGAVPRVARRRRRRELRGHAPARPHQNANSLEVNGEKGSLRFDFEDMNLLTSTTPRAGRARAAGRASCAPPRPASTSYAGHWWPGAHVLV